MEYQGIDELYFYDQTCGYFGQFTFVVSAAITSKGKQCCGKESSICSPLSAQRWVCCFVAPLLLNDHRGNIVANTSHCNGLVCWSIKLYGEVVVESYRERETQWDWVHPSPCILARYTTAVNLVILLPTLSLHRRNRQHHKHWGINRWPHSNTQYSRKIKVSLTQPHLDWPVCTWWNWSKEKNNKKKMDLIWSSF